MNRRDPETLKKLIGQRIRLLRRDRNWTQQYIADKLNVSLATVSAYERGERQAPADNLDVLANLFGVSVDYLMGRTNDPTPSPGSSFELVNSDSLHDDIETIAASGFELDQFDPEFLEKIKEVIQWAYNKYERPKRERGEG